MPAMTTDPTAPLKPASPWPWRWALLLCCLTFPLLWVGGLVTSTDAGMAVEDWPTTYGYNMFLYPWKSWLFGPWDLFVEHGHRLLGSLVGLVTIGLVVAVCMTDSRRWLRWLAVAALALVIVQGLLGGMRVVFNERQLAMVHGCTGPAFFAVAMILLVVTSRSWLAAGAANGRTPAGLFLATALFAYLQLVLGAQLRHVPVTVSPWAFAAIVKLHLAMAAVVFGNVLWSAHRVRRSPQAPRAVKRLGAAMSVAVVLQVCLGASAWLAKYGFPSWAAAWRPATMGATVADGMAQTLIATAHSACGSLILGLAAAAAAYAFGHAGDATSPTPVS